MVFELLNWFITNKEVLKILYGLFIGVVCLLIVYKSDKLYRLSFHKGIRYFRNAFLFYGVGFLIRYLFISFFFRGMNPLYYSIVNMLFEFFLIMGGFFILYSLLWKRIEGDRENYKSSLFNLNIFIFYIMAIVIVLLDYLWGGFNFMFYSQIILFAFVSVKSFINYKRNGKRHRFLKFYFLSMILSFIAWALNAFSTLYFNLTNILLMEVYLINLIIFLLFLWGVFNVTKKKQIK